MVENIKGMVRYVQRYLPRNAKIVELGTYYDALALDEKDIDGDNMEELTTIYKKEDIYSLFILKRERRSWINLWNEVLDYDEIVYFKILPFTNERKHQIMIGGRKETTAPGKYELSILEYTKEGVLPISDCIIEFNKIDTQMIDNKMQLIIWNHTLLEAYDIKMYRWDRQSLVEGGWYEVGYFESVERYYQYLADVYPDEVIYRTCLEYAQIKNGKALYKEETVQQEAFDEQVEEIKAQEKKDREQESKEQSIQQEVEEQKIVKEKQEQESQKQESPKGSPILEVKDIYYELNCRSEICIMGNKKKIGSEEWIENICIISQKDNKSQVIYANNKEKVQYKLFIGPLVDEYSEAIVLKLTMEALQQPIYQVYKDIEGTVSPILNSHEWRKECEIQEFPEIKIIWDEKRQCYGMIGVYSLYNAKTKALEGYKTIPIIIGKSGIEKREENELRIVVR